MNINKVTIGGRLTRDPELKSLPSGKYVGSFSVAINSRWKGADGNTVERVEYVNCIVFGKTAETISKYFKKGSRIYVEGRIQTRDWEEKDTGKKIYRTEVIVSEFQFVDSVQKENKEDTATEVKATRKPASTERARIDAEGTIDYGESINPEDIPF